MTGLVVNKAEDGIISMMAMVKISFEYLELYATGIIAYI